MNNVDVFDQTSYRIRFEFLHRLSQGGDNPNFLLNELLS